MKIIKKIKQKIIEIIALDKGDLWKQMVIKTLCNSLSEQERWNLIRSHDEILMLCGIWNASESKLHEYSVNRLNQYWTIRASIALNSGTSKSLLNRLYTLNLCDMSDIQMFISRNPNFSV